MKSVNKVCVVAPVHHYEDIRIFKKEIMALVKAGYDVTLIARKTDNSFHENVKIIPMPQYRNRMQRFLLQPWVLFQVMKARTPIVHLHNPDTLFVGFFLKMLGKKIIYDTHEDYTKRILIKHWIPKSLRNIMAKVIGVLEQVCGGLFNASIATEEAVVKRLGKKAVLVENAPIPHGELIEKAYKLSESIQKTDHVYRVIYAGGLTKARGLFQMIEAMELINKEVKARLWLIGVSNDDNVLNEIKKLKGWEYVDFFGFLPQEVAFSYMIKADVGLVPYLNVGGHDKANPNKIFEYQRFGLPFVASDFELWKNHMDNSKTGLFVNPESSIEIAEATIFLLKNRAKASEMGELGKKQILHRYNWDIESKKLLDVYNSITTG